jgi:hypothetical protein
MNDSPVISGLRVAMGSSTYPVDHPSDLAVEKAAEGIRVAARHRGISLGAPEAREAETLAAAALDAAAHSGEVVLRATHEREIEYITARSGRWGRRACHAEVVVDALRCRIQKALKALAETDPISAGLAADLLNIVLDPMSGIVPPKGGFIHHRHFGDEAGSDAR